METLIQYFTDASNEIVATYLIGIFFVIYFAARHFNQPLKELKQEFPGEVKKVPQPALPCYMTECARNRLFLGLSLGITTLIAGCSVNPQKQLERVAKDWCETIRASQVLPVYPLSEDVEPGDVFLVQTPLSRQTEIYQQKGYLPLDQLVTRLARHSDTNGAYLDYAAFYKHSYWKNPYGDKLPNERPGWGADNAPVNAPKVAFPSYSFAIRRGGGLSLALPLQGVPVGMGLMGADQAVGTVILDDAYTYGVDAELALTALRKWWNSNPRRRVELLRVAEQAQDPVFFRILTRVYITRKVTVTLNRASTFGFGADAGVSPPKVSIPDLTTAKDKEEVDIATTAYKSSLDALSNIASGDAVGATPSGAFRFVHADARSVTLDQEFKRPLVIGFRGFDVRLFRNGRLSAPIPSYTVLNEKITADRFGAGSDYERIKGMVGVLQRLGKTDDNDQLAYRDQVINKTIKKLPTELRKLYEQNMKRMGNRPMRAFGLAVSDYVNAGGSASEMDLRRHMIYEALSTSLGKGDR